MTERVHALLQGLRRHQGLRVTALIMVLSILMAACAPVATPGTTADESPDVVDEANVPDDTELAAQPGGTMIWLGHQEVAGLGPADTGPTVQAVLINNILNPLAYYNEYAELELVLAESYEVSEDGLTYTFTLPEGVTFHDGSDFTAEDVKYTYDFYRENPTPIQGEFFGMESVETPDDYTVVVNMSEVNAASLSNWGAVPIVPSDYHAEVGEEVFRTAPIGTGAYMLSEWNPAEFTEIVAYEDHFRGRPYIDTIRLDVVPEASVRTIALQSGDADSSVWPLLVEDSILLEEDPNFILYRTLADSIKHFPLNLENPVLADPAVRKAMMHALDRQRIIDDLWNGAAQVAHSNLSPKNQFYHAPDLPEYEYDPELAVQMLEEAGWVDEDGDGVRECVDCTTAEEGTPLFFTITTITGDQARQPIAVLAQQMLADVGIEVQLAEAPVSTILEELRNNTMDSSIFNWTYGSTPEPDPFATLHSEGGDNFTGYSDPEMDELIEQGTQIVDPEERQEIYARIQEKFVEDVPVLYLQFDEWMNPFSARIQGLPENPLLADPIYYRAHTYWIAE